LNVNAGADKEKPAAKVNSYRWYCSCHWRPAVGCKRA